MNGYVITTRKATAFDWAVRFAIVGLTLYAGYIHSTLGGLLYTANAAGYATLAVAFIVPLGLAERFRWLVRIALGGFTSATIVGWILFGARYSTGYIATGVEVAIVVLLTIDFVRAHGNPVGIARRALSLLGSPRRSVEA